jgi:hypothetical protein
MQAATLLSSLDRRRFPMAIRPLDEAVATNASD